MRPLGKIHGELHKNIVKRGPVHGLEISEMKYESPEIRPSIGNNLILNSLINLFA
jgi:hypothetical protein